MDLVLVESPFAFKSESMEIRRLGLLRNMTYARCAVRDCLSRGEAPYASHLFFTQPFVLDDDIPEERQLGIDAGLLWGAQAARSVFYIDLGISGGMRYGLENAKKSGRPIVERSLPGWQQCLHESPEESLIRLGLYEEDEIVRIRLGHDTFFVGELAVVKSPVVDSQEVNQLMHSIGSR